MKLTQRKKNILLLTAFSALYLYFWFHRASIQASNLSPNLEGVSQEDHQTTTMEAIAHVYKPEPNMDSIKSFWLQNEVVATPTAAGTLDSKKHRIAIVLFGPTRSFPHQFQYTALLNYLVTPFRNNSQFEVSLFLRLGLDKQAVDKEAQEVVDLPLSFLEPAFAALNPDSVIIHDDSLNPEKCPSGENSTEWDTRESAYGFLVKTDLNAKVIMNWEQKHGFKFDSILSSRIDGWWPTETTTFVPARNTIHGRIINYSCGYGGLDHLYYGSRDAMMNFMMIWSNVSKEFIIEAKADPKCTSCFGLECLHYNWLKLQQIEFMDDYGNNGLAQPASWHYNPVFEI